MEIEVRQPTLVYVKAFVEEVTPNGINVSYENSWHPNEFVTYDRCRVVFADGIASPLSPSSITVKDFIEAYVKQTSIEVSAWQKMRVRDVKGAFIVVESIDGPPNNEIVSIDRCRLLNTATNLSYDNYRQHLVKVSDDLHNYLKNPQTYKDLTDLVENIHVEYLKDTHELRICSFSNKSIRMVELLIDTFLSNAKQKKILLERQEEAKRLLLKNEKVTEVVEEFTVPAELMGLAIGAHGINISNARKIEGVEDVVIDKTQRPNGTCLFKILAKTKEAASQARNILEFMIITVPVPQNMVGQVIGKSGRNIQDIVDKSNVIRVQIADESDENANTINFMFTGTKEAISLAKLLIQMHLKHLKDMDELRESCEEVNRKLFHRTPSLSNGQYGGPRRFNDNSSHANGPPNRFRNGPNRNSNGNGPANGHVQGVRQGRYYNKPVNGNTVNGSNGGVVEENNVKDVSPSDSVDKKITEKNAGKFESARRDTREEGKKNLPKNRKNFKTMPCRPVSPINDAVDKRHSERRIYPDVSGDNDLADLSYSTVGTKIHEMTFEEEDSFEENVISTTNNTTYQLNTLKKRRSVTRRLEPHVGTPGSFHNSSASSIPNVSSADFKFGSTTDTFSEIYDSIMNIFDEYICEPFNNVFEDSPVSKIIGIFLLLLIAIFVFLLFPFNSFNNLTSSNSLDEALLADLRATTTSQFHDDKRAYALLLYMFQVLSIGEAQAPVVVLLSGEWAKTNKFIEQFKQLLSRHKKAIVAPLDVSVQPSLLRRELENNLYNYLKISSGNRVIVLRGIDNLTTTTPLFLHAVSDPDTAPYKQLLAIVTTSSPADKQRDESKTQSIRCDERVTDHLLQRWSTDLKVDKIYPIISRISAILMCFD